MLIDFEHEDCCIKYKLLVACEVLPGRRGGMVEAPTQPWVKIESVTVESAQVERDKMLYDIRPDDNFGFSRIEADLKYVLERDEEFLQKARDMSGWRLAG